MKNNIFLALHRQFLQVEKIKKIKQKIFFKKSKMFTDEHGHEMTKEEKVEEVKELNGIVSEMLWSELRLTERAGRRKKKAELLEKMKAGFAPVKVEVNVEVTLEPEGHVEVNVAVSVKKRKQSKRRRRRRRKRVTQSEM